MTQISRRYLSQEILEKILDIFLSSFLRIKDRKTAEGFFDEFLTPTEKIMLAKRIVCLYLLYKKITIREIKDILKLSTATVAKYSIFLQRSQVIKRILPQILRKENFIRIIDTFINEFLTSPTKYGTDWKLGWKLQNEYQQRKQTPF